MYACRYGQIVVFAYDAAEQNAAEVEEELMKS